MSRATRERVRLAKRAEYQATKPLKLVMGESNRCFYNATCAVWERPDRLAYVEGFHINEYWLTPHAWVMDKLTGARHEVTPMPDGYADDRDDPDAVYIGKEFTKDEMINLVDDLCDGPEYWMSLLTLQDQFDMLTAAGYDVELTKYHNAGAETDWLVEDDVVIDPSSIDLTSAFRYYEELDDDWEYRWRRKIDARTKIKAAPEGTAITNPVA